MESSNAERDVLRLHDHDHDDIADPDDEAGLGFWYYLDNIELRSIGIDIGSSTSHLIFSRSLLRREAQSLSSRFVVVEQETIWRSDVRLTPYLSNGLIDADELSRFVRQGRDEADLTRDQIDTGVVILTGEALKRVNARRIATALAAEAGDFVSVSAGHHLEATLAAYGSGTVALSRDHDDPILLVDVGGGTTKFALVEHGVVAVTGAIEIGGRLLAWDADRTLHWVSPSLAAFAEQAGHLKVGDRLSEKDESALVDEMARRILSVCRGEVDRLDPAIVLADNGLSGVGRLGSVAFSGGVSEYVYGRERIGYGDLGAALGARLRAALMSAEAPYRLVEPDLGIRATVVGASQSSAQVSGSTVMVADGTLPARNIPVLHPRVRLGSEFNSDQVSRAISTELRLRDLTNADAYALAFGWSGPPAYARLAALADGILDAAGSRRAAAGPIAVIVDADLAATLGRVLAERSSAPFICLDNIVLQQFDHIDIGSRREPAGVYPVMIKSLLFGSAAPTQAE